MKPTYSDEFNWWQRVLQVVLGMWRINDSSIDFKWGYFAPRFGLKFVLNRGGYEDDHYSIAFCLIWGEICITLPLKTKLGEQVNSPRYGFAIHNNIFWVYLGGSIHKDYNEINEKWWTWDLPFFEYLFDSHEVWTKQGKFEVASSDKAKLGGLDRFDFIQENALKETHDYTYTLKSGDIQKVTATIYRERRTWHRKWFPFLKSVRDSIDIEFSDEVGERAGSWKGGCIGCSYDINPGESMLDCLRRMEKERKF